MTQDLLTTCITGLALADVDNVSARRDEPAWLRDLRHDAWRQYETMDFPDVYDEEWRRTDVRSLTFEGLRSLSASAPVATAAELPAPLRSAWGEGALAGRVIQHDSDVVRLELDDALRARGVILTDMHTAAREHPGLIQRHFAQTVTAAEWKYLALNAALWSGGCFLYVPANVEVALPVQLATVASTGGLALFPRTLVVVDRNAKVTFIDETLSPDHVTKSLVSAAVEIVVGEGAHVEYYDVNRWGNNVYNFKTVRATLGRDAQLRAAAVGIGSRLTKMRIDTLMPQPGARAELLGVTFGDGDQHFDYNTLQDHVGEHTISDLQFKSALAGNASLVWYGITRIEPPAAGSEANQTSRNLLLSEHAKASPIPVLEIEAWDVSKCSHGATAGPVDEDQLFYLQARAIPREVAERMLVEGFFADVIDRIPDARLRDRVLDAVLAKAGGSAGMVSFDDVAGA
ncbi:MAG TPA: Fe-S cluster assembly protein SufD [Dehalococcoidia bacterium]|nr:Fe-S cluster assembly protein SufD [Dehalococcoidia bacterium]